MKIRILGNCKYVFKHVSIVDIAFKFGTTQFSIYHIHEKSTFCCSLQHAHIDN